MPILFGGAIGFMVGYAAKLGKVRNSGLVLLFGLGFGLLSEFLGWVVWVHADDSGLILNPVELMGEIQLVAVRGAWSVFGWTPTGF
jgi:hypothetical protein